MEEPTLILTDFQGPLDLLLHLIKEAKIDIYDIPIAQITTQYLNFLHEMQADDLEIAGNYVVMAATLMAIKSRMLLPQPPRQNTDEDDESDPRQQLVSQLIAYEKFQQVASILQDKAIERQNYFSKPQSILETEHIIPMKPGIVTANALALAVSRMLFRQGQKRVKHRTVNREEISLADKSAAIMNQLKYQSKMSFEAALDRQTSVEDIVTTFLAVLELMKDGQVICTQTDFAQPIIIQLKE